MIFEKEVSLYAKEAILKRFLANETSLSVAQGKISALISESELTELESSKSTMYSKLASVQLDVSGLTESFSDLTTKYDDVTGKYTNLNSKVAEYKRTVDGLSTNLTNINTQITNEYSTTNEMNAAIKAGVDGLSTTVSSTYVTKDTLKNYSTTENMNTAISISASGVISKVEALGETVNQKNGNYYGTTEPTLNNLPASAWNKEDLKKQHNGDIYVQTTTGNTYRYYYGEAGLLIKFSKNSRTEDVRYDYVEIYYSDNGTMKCAAKLGGTGIAGATVYVPTQEFYVYWHTDSSSDSYYGFKIESVTRGSGIKTGTSQALPGYTVTTMAAGAYPESSHGSYGNNVNNLWKCTGPAVGSKMEFWERIEIATKMDVSSIIEQSADTIRLKASKISWSSTYSSMTEEGKLTCEEATINGDFATKQPWNSSYKKTELKEGVIKGYIGETQCGILDMSAHYADNKRHVALNAYDYLHLQAGAQIKIENNVAIQGTLGITGNLYGINNSFLRFGSSSIFSSDVSIDGITILSKPPQMFNYTVNTSGRNIVFAADGKTLACASSSSKRYKNHVRFMERADVDAFWKLPTVWFVYKEGYLPKEDQMYGKPVPGFYAEDMRELIPAATRYQNGQVEDWNERMLIPYMVAAIQQLHPEHGHGILSEDGQCIILLDTIENQYYITITKYGEGDLYISKKEINSFTVTGTPELEFDWQVTAA